MYVHVHLVLVAMEAIAKKLFDKLLNLLEDKVHLLPCVYTCTV